MRRLPWQQQQAALAARVEQPQHIRRELVQLATDRALGAWVAVYLAAGLIAPWEAMRIGT